MGPRCLTAVLGASHSCPRARRFDKLSRVTQLGSVVPRGRPAYLGDSGGVRMPAVSTSCPARLMPGSKVLRGRPALLSILGQGRGARGVDQLSWATRARNRGPVWFTSSPRRVVLGFEGLGWTSSPGRFSPVSQVPRCLPAILGNSGQCPRARNVDQLSWATHAWVRGPACLTSCPG